MTPRHERYAEAYLAMAQQAKYRPEAPSDGLGNISLTDAELADQQRLAGEATTYAVRFGREDDACAFWIGCSNFRTNRAFVWAIEAARQLASGSDGEATALRLLRMARDEIKRAQCERSTAGAGR
jgi:hypothetical protein